MCLLLFELFCLGGGGSGRVDLKEKADLLGAQSMSGLILFITIIIISSSSSSTVAL